MFCLSLFCLDSASAAHLQIQHSADVRMACVEEGAENVMYAFARDKDLV